MSDSEEPASKIIKLENPEQGQEMEEGQEEWLSEEGLTDDDYNPGADNEQSDYANMSQEDTMASMNDSMDNHNIYHDTGDSNAQDGLDRDNENIEEALNNLENSQDKDFPEELGAFLIRKTDNRALKKEPKEERRESPIQESARNTDDDGHDTDELLRVLGDDGSKGNKKHVLKNVKEKIREMSSDDDDDDEYIFEGAKVTRLKMAKNAFIKKYPSKAVPEDLSDKEDSETVKARDSTRRYLKAPRNTRSHEEAQTVKSMFGISRRPANVASKSTTIGGINALQTVTKRVVSLDGSIERHPISTPHRQVIVKQVRGPGRPPKPKVEPEEIINEEEFLEEGFDLDQDMESESEIAIQDEAGNKSKQKIMRPERMEEEIPTDGESQSDEESLYDDIPSSESEDLDEWFTLDIRNERAGDYLPLLGSNARQVLTKEKQRIGARLATLRQSLSALTESGRQQSEQLRKATATLAELDAALKAS